MQEAECKTQYAEEQSVVHLRTCEARAHSLTLSLGGTRPQRSKSISGAAEGGLAGSDFDQRLLTRAGDAASTCETSRRVYAACIRVKGVGVTVLTGALNVV